MVGVRWSKEELKFLTENYGKLPVETIAEKLGRTVNAVEGKAHRLGLKKVVYYPPHLKKVINSNTSTGLIDEIERLDREIRLLIHILGRKFEALAEDVRKKIKPMEKDLNIKIVDVEVKHDPEDPTYKYILVTISSEKLTKLSKESDLDAWFDEYRNVLNAAHDWIDEHFPSYGKHILFVARE